jgi:hypothetical protein
LVEKHKPGVVIHNCNASTWREEDGKLETSLDLMSSSQPA